MSLDKVASHLAAQGRGPDTTLVHMSPREVDALQGIARRHGGSLTINPQTGLAEAGFLDAILPMVAGAGLSMIPGVGPLMAAGIVGAGTGLLTKDLNKGLMAGLGAFGGASLAGSIAGMGTAAGSTAAAGEAAAATSSLYTPAEVASMQAAGMTPAQITASAADFVGGPSGIGTANMPFSQATQSALSNPATAGMSEISKAPGAFFKKNMFPIGMAAAPLLAGGSDLFGGGKQEQPESSPTYIRPQAYSQTRNPNYTGAGTPYFTQSYTPQTPVVASEWGNRSFADGGTVGALGISGLGPQAAAGGFAPVITYDPVTKQYVNAVPTAAPAVKNIFTYNPATQQYIDTSTETITPDAGLPAIGTNQMGYYNAGNSGGGGDAGSDSQAEANAAADSAAGVAAGEQASPGADAAANAAAEAAAAGEAAGEAAGDSDGNGNASGNAGDSDGGAGAWAEGGITNSKMAAVDKYVATAQSGQQGMQQVMALAKSGDYNAAIALNKLNATPNQNYAMGGIASLGSYSDGGRLLKGPGDGVSDSIPAIIGDRQPARLANEEFVVPARIVSELGNGSSEAGAKELYKMMERVQNGREKSIGTGKVAVDSKAYKHLPA